MMGVGLDDLVVLDTQSNPGEQLTARERHTAPRTRCFR